MVKLRMPADFSVTHIERHEIMKELSNGNIFMHPKPDGKNRVCQKTPGSTE